MKKFKQYKGFFIYRKSEKELKRDFENGIISYEYEVYLPDETPENYGAAEFECETLEECIENIESY
jgi:hypothetical protein